MVLQRARDDFRGTRRTAVHDRDNRQARPLLRLRIGVLMRGAGGTTAGLDDRLARIEEQIRHGHALIEQTAGILAEIENQRLHALLEQRVHRLRNFTGRALADRIERDVADVIVQHHRDLDRPDVNRGARELELDRIIDAQPPNGQLRRRTRRPAQLLHRLILFPPFRGAAVQLDNAVTRLNAGTLGRRIGQRRDDGDPAVAHVDLNAEA